MFSQNKEFLNYEDPSTNLRRSQITLFDSLRNPIAKVDATICLSLLDSYSVEAIRERERKKGTAIKDARIAHKDLEVDDYDNEEQKYDLKVSKPFIPPPTHKIITTKGTILHFSHHYRRSEQSSK